MDAQRTEETYPVSNTASKIGSAGNMPLCKQLFPSNPLASPQFPEQGWVHSMCSVSIC